MNSPSAHPELAQAMQQHPTFKAIESEVDHEREMQKVRWNYTYHVSGTVAAQATSPFTITVEQGTDFKCQWITGSAFAYASGNTTEFPMPGAANTNWSGRGLSIKITDTRSGRELTSGYVPVELLLTPGYGNNFQHPYPFRYFFYRNTKIRFDVRNRDVSGSKAQSFDIALNGYKILTPGL